MSTLTLPKRCSGNRLDILEGVTIYSFAHKEEQATAIGLVANLDGTYTLIVERHISARGGVYGQHNIPFRLPSGVGVAPGRPEEWEITEYPERLMPILAEIATMEPIEEESII
jgi:hypothetical protein